MVSKDEVLKAQERWAGYIIEIGSLKSDQIEAKAKAIELLNSLYAFSEANVLFKPTKASEAPFRNDPESALSYFVGENPKHPEDKGFALEPWKNIEFKNSGFYFGDNSALAMGHYFFTSAEDKTIKVEYSFSYIKVKDSLKINLHHSSLPYSL